MTYFHGTSEQSARTILRDGLLCDRDQGVAQPTEEEFEQIDEPYLWDGVWVTNSVERAQDFGSVLLTVDADGLEVFEDYEFEPGRSDVCIVGSISPDRIRRSES